MWRIKSNPFWKVQKTPIYQTFRRNLLNLLVSYYCLVYFSEMFTNICCLFIVNLVRGNYLSLCIYIIYVNHSSVTNCVLARGNKYIFRIYFFGFELCYLLLNYVILWNEHFWHKIMDFLPLNFKYLLADRITMDKKLLMNHNWTWTGLAIVNITM